MSVGFFPKGNVEKPVESCQVDRPLQTDLLVLGVEKEVPSGEVERWRGGGAELQKNHSGFRPGRWQGASFRECFTQK